MNTNNTQSCIVPLYSPWGYPPPYVPLWYVPYLQPVFPYWLYPYTTQITTGTNIVLQPNNQSK